VLELYFGTSMDHHQNDATDTEATAQPTAATPSNDTDRSRRIYERIFAEAIAEAPSTDVSIIAPAAEERYSYVISIAGTESSRNSAPTDEEEWRGQNQQPNDTTTESIASLSDAVAADDEASVSNQQQHDHGGRLWRLAGEVAAGQASLLGKNRSGPVGHLAETFRERMRSRADPDALVTPPTPPRPDRK
jgi:hypothetical protein